MDLSQYTLPKLKQLNARISKEIEKQQSASKVSVLKKLKQLAREHGLSLEDVLADSIAISSTTKAASKPAASKPAAARKAPLPAKYRHPNNRDLGWSGRGRKPQWVAAWLDNGGSMDALEVTAQKFAKKLSRPPASMDVDQTEPAKTESDASSTTGG